MLTLRIGITNLEHLKLQLKMFILVGSVSTKTASRKNQVDICNLSKASGPFL